MKKTGLYVHFPFCRRACFYCHFFKKKFTGAAAGAYLDHLLKEIVLRGDRQRPVDTVYFGGGSPSLLAPAQASRALEAAASHFRLDRHAEVTLEANPEDLDEPLLRGFRRAGINRLSIGAQSFQDDDLRCLKRTHGAAQARRALEMARATGFANISIDLIIGLETQTAATTDRNLRMIEALKPDHVSVYILENVPRPEADERDARLYFQARQGLLGLGYGHYEVSNYCLPGKASRHNLKYWQNLPYTGVGASAAGFLDGVDYRDRADLKKYQAALDRGELPQVRTRPLDPARRRIISGLRLLDGIPAAAFTPFAARTAFLLDEGFLVRRGGNIAVPFDKILLLNEILGYFI